MTAFFTKKQKAEYRKRKKRVKQALAKDPTQQRTSNKKKQGEVVVEEKDDAGATNILPVENGKGQENIVNVPKHLSQQESKKFRKDARRKARKEGKNADLLEFIEEGTEVKNEPEVDKTENKKKKRKREFPCLNDLVKEQEEAKRKQEENDARQKAEENLLEEYKSRYVALDCEMVGIGTDGKKSVLARVSLVDWDGEVVMDTFVQVPTRVTDFRTHVSGVTPKDIKGGAGAMKESECREKVAKILRGKVLVGHALKNDLHALLLTHPKSDIRDTAKYRPFQRLGGSKWRPRKLRDLVKENLGLDIQRAGQSHDSTEDARATMQLFRLVREEWERDLEEKASKKKRKTP